MTILKGEYWECNCKRFYYHFAETVEECTRCFAHKDDSKIVYLIPQEHDTDEFYNGIYELSETEHAVAVTIINVPAFYYGQWELIDEYSYTSNIVEKAAYMAELFHHLKGWSYIGYELSDDEKESVDWEKVWLWVNDDE